MKAKANGAVNPACFSFTLTKTPTFLQSILAAVEQLLVEFPSQKFVVLLVVKEKQIWFTALDLSAERSLVLSWLPALKKVTI